MDLFFLLLLSIPFVIFPWLFRIHEPEQTDDVERKKTNNNLYESQCRYFQNQFRIGVISEYQFSSLMLDARQILTDDTKYSVAFNSHKKGLWLIPSVIIMLFSSVFFLYSHLGSERDQMIFNILSSYSIGDEPEIVDGEDREALISLIEERIKERPKNIHYWVLLAKFAQHKLEYRDAVDYYASALVLDPNNSYILANYAEVLFLADGSRVTDRVIKAIEAAFISDPESSKVLGLKGIEAYTEKGFLDAIRFWQLAKRGLDKDSNDMIAIQRGIDRATRALSIPVESHPAENFKDDLPSSVKGHHAEEITKIDLSLGNMFARSSSDEVFLLVFKAGFSDVPLMAKSVRLMSLPTYVVFSNTDLLDSSGVLSDLRHVEVVARIYGEGNGFAPGKNLELRSRPINLLIEPMPIAVALNRQQ